MPRAQPVELEDCTAVACHCTFKPSWLNRKSGIKQLMCQLINHKTEHNDSAVICGCNTSPTQFQFTNESIYSLKQINNITL